MHARVTFHFHHSRRRAGFLSIGHWIIVAIAIGSTVIVLLRPETHANGLEMWTFAKEHYLAYKPMAAEWNRTHQPNTNLFLFSPDALAHRMMAAFLSGLPCADMIEVERGEIGPVFAGPAADIGFVDLTQRLKSEGLLDQINFPSFSPWTNRGHIYGLPHDVHPVMLAYRSDIVEAAGIDVSQIHTWDDFARVMLPLTGHLGPDGTPDHYPINLWCTSIDQIETLILQAGGGFFDERGRPVIASDTNARVIATVASWMVGPNRIAADAPEYTAAGNRLRLDGYVVCSIMPDWLGGHWKADLKPLAGKLKLMPLPAWTPGGRRTSVWGGTMLGICKRTTDFEAAWAFARHLYLSPELARKLYESNDIISPVKSLWPSAYYDAPDPFFSGQPIGRMYIRLAPDVPLRSSSPFNSLAKLRVEDAVVRLHAYAVSTGTFDASKLMPQALRLLNLAEESIRREMDRNVFWADAN
jgi:arabinosaccharide transport system substrate-binding protein